MKTNQAEQQKMLNSFYLVSDRLRDLSLQYEEFSTQNKNTGEPNSKRLKDVFLQSKRELTHYKKNIRDSLKRYTLEKKKLSKILITKYKIKPFDYHKSKKVYHRSDFAKSYVDYLSTGGIQSDLYVKKKDRKFQWQIFGTLTAGFEQFSAKTCIRLVEKYFERLCDEVSDNGKHFVKFFCVIEKFNTKYNGKDRYHIHYLLDCPTVVSDIDFFNYLGDVRNRREVTFAPHTIWQDLLGEKPQIFGKDNWSDIENGTVPKTAQFHRTNFKRIQQNTDDYEKAISYIVKYMCKDGLGEPHYRMFTSADLLRKRWRELMITYENKKQHLKTFGCTYLLNATHSKTGDVWELYDKSDKYIYKSKSRDKFVENGNVVSLKCPPSLDGYIQASKPEISDEVGLVLDSQHTPSMQLTMHPEWDASHTALPSEVKKLVN